jgi:hypothetical protein
MRRYLAPQPEQTFQHPAADPAIAMSTDREKVFPLIVTNSHKSPWQEVWPRYSNENEN